MIVPAVFWLCLGLLVYVYFGYPLLCRLLAAVLQRGIREIPPTDAALPRVSIVHVTYPCFFAM